MITLKSLIQPLDADSTPPPPLAKREPGKAAAGGKRPDIVLPDTKGRRS
ncbi:hypothetical protein [Streptomyces sp. 5-10]|nr:hypothetical protein [Streptomyces sp. 5-10]MBD3004619.1 hypothetical protein [Streptomyces sp. 5-10]